MAAFLLSCPALRLGAQSSTASPANAPASVPAGADVPTPAQPPSHEAQADVSPRHLREAEDAFLRGAKALDRKDLRAAEQDFLLATERNPLKRDYALALAVTREHILTDLVQRAAKARTLGHTAEAEALLQQARALDPDNAVVRQHFDPDGALSALPALFQADPMSAQRAADALTLAGPVTLSPTPGVHSFHLRADATQILQNICSAYGLKVSFPVQLEAGPPIRFDLEKADFTSAIRVAENLTHTFSVPLQPNEVLFAKDNPENRAQYEPLVEETLFLPGTSQEALTEYANMARNVFNLRVVNALSGSGSLVLRGDANTLSHVNATFADLVDGGADVLVDITLYEIDQSKKRELGITTPSSAGVFSVYSEAQSILSANQSTIQTAIANNLITLTGNTYTDQLTELVFLLGSGVVSSTQFSNLLGVIGHFGGLPLAGVFLGSGATLNALLSSSDVRLLDSLQLRAGDHGPAQEASFRAGTRYPIETGVYSSAGTSALSSALSGLNINGTSVSSLLAQYGASSSVSVPQIQFEDLGLTLKATPHVLRSHDVTLKLDFKVEALGSGTINGLPILNNRQLASTVTIPAGQTALIASEVSRSELRSINGLPFLSELPGFQGTDKSKEVDTTELLITLTPHVIRNKGVQITSRRLLLAKGEKTRD